MRSRENVGEKKKKKGERLILCDHVTTIGSLKP